MWHWSDDVWMQERHQRFLHEAQQRQIHSALAHRQTSRYYSPALAWFGQRLIAWGSRIQARHTTSNSPHNMFDA